MYSNEEIIQERGTGWSVLVRYLDTAHRGKRKLIIRLMVQMSGLFTEGGSRSRLGSQ